MNKIKAISEAMEYIDEETALLRNLRPNIWIIKDNCDPEVKKVLMNLIYDENIGGNNDLSYMICGQACQVIADTDESELIDGCSFESEQASIYTMDRIGYLNINNESEITDILKELNTDINTACAIWFDNMVNNACYKLLDFIIEDAQ